MAGEKELAGVNIYHFNDQRRLETVRYAGTADFEDGAWQLSQVDTSDLTNPNQVTSTQTLTGVWKTNLTPDKLGVVALDPDSLSISGLHNYVKYLKQSGQEASRYQLNMWSKIFSPLSVAVMMLMALSFIFGPLRSVPMGVRGGDRYQLRLPVLRAGSDLWPAEPGVQHAANSGGAVAKHVVPVN
ncbi:Lipopolysaccharide export system permease protein lptG [Serratia fonticola]|uniref:Lipopolysaccharide export system permease protein lptG n=1 Tax=Serratia fonticola TaxID=47917 RepID=A0A4V6KLC6_SERFO|nr:Lipopolysaccharide export system permease protein lptG [Serratia fonticola]